jgi:hypothetical protein
MCENAIDSDIGPISPAYVWARLTGNLSLLRVKPNEAATHDIVGCNRNVEDGSATTELRFFRVLQAPAQHKLFAGEAVRA